VVADPVNNTLVNSTAPQNPIKFVRADNNYHYFRFRSLTIKHPKAPLDEECDCGAQGAVVIITDDRDDEQVLCEVHYAQAMASEHVRKRRVHIRATAKSFNLYLCICMLAFVFSILFAL
jgi:hypothetical protein